ncbi:hypothetical protein B0H17DRAFT_1129201 [Mycena rosella]|uniref:Uncharacterized protein n=1 Tax=Mycena rosella TaxID=1033263 RepID=A0AAD7DTT4_MYCRO|nr:hypothetical protein B0H17DRAFT_1129201 [Mycena rosella]
MPPLSPPPSPRLSSRLHSPSLEEEIRLLDIVVEREEREHLERERHKGQELQLAIQLSQEAYRQPPAQFSQDDDEILSIREPYGMTIMVRFPSNWYLGLSACRTIKELLMVLIYLGFIFWVYTMVVSHPFVDLRYIGVASTNSNERLKVVAHCPVFAILGKRQKKSSAKSAKVAQYQVTDNSTRPSSQHDIDIISPEVELLTFGLP